MKCILCGREVSKLYNNEVCEQCVKDYNLSAENLSGDVPFGYVEKKECTGVSAEIKRKLRILALSMTSFGFLGSLLQIILRKLYNPILLLSLILGYIIGTVVWYYFILYIAKAVYKNK